MTALVEVRAARREPADRARSVVGQPRVTGLAPSALKYGISGSAKTDVALLC